MNGRPAKKRRTFPPEPEDDALTASDMDGLLEPSFAGSEIETRTNGTLGSTGNVANQSLEDTRDTLDNPDRIKIPEIKAFKLESSSNKSAASIGSPGAISSFSIFRMQCQELIHNITQQTESRRPPFEDALDSIKAAIAKAPLRKPLPVDLAEKELLKLYKISVPFPYPRPHACVKYQLSFSKPSSIITTRDFVSARSNPVEEKSAIDIVVTMPASLFTEKDYLNLRYFHKRSFYLACIAAAIEEDLGSSFKLDFSYQHGNPLLPVILLQQSEESDASSFQECKVLLAVPRNVFPLSKVLPHRNCVRPRLRDQTSQTELDATPFYNASLCADTSFDHYKKLLNNALAQSAGFADACLLGSVWLRQRGFQSDLQQGGFGSPEWSALLAFLLCDGGSGGRPIFSLKYDGHQLFRATLHFLASRDLVRQPLIIGQTKLGSYDMKGVPMLFDGSSSTNLLYRMSMWSYEALRQEAQTTIQMLSTPSSDYFEAVFILKTKETLMRYDLVGRFPIKTLKLETGSQDVQLAALQKAQEIHSVLRRGLGNRVRAIKVDLPGSKAWSIHIARNNRMRDERMTILMSVDAEHNCRTVDRGPPRDRPEAAAEFQRFWGSKTDLRRFKDGSILESVVWDIPEPADLITGIIKHLLATHFSEESANAFELIDIGLKTVCSSIDISPDISPMMTAYKKLEKSMRSLEGLPLQIEQIRPTGSQLSFSSLHHDSAPGEIILQFESSTRWPDDLMTIQMTKIAFLLKIAELLQASTQEMMRLRICLENEASNILNQSFLEIMYPNGVTFHVRIHHGRESTLSSRLLSDPSTLANVREAAATALASHRRTFDKRPAYTQALQILSTRHPALLKTIRLTKLWFDNHLLSPFFPEPLIETFVVRCFVQPYPWSPPSTPIVGLLRTLLYLSRWSWQSDPLIVDYNTPSLKKEDIAEINTRFQAWRKIDSALNRIALFVATDFDKEGSTWTEHTPSKVIAARMTTLARAACGIVKGKGAELRLPALYHHSYDDYDFVIHLKRKFARAWPEHDHQQFKNLHREWTSRGLKHMVFDYLRELQDAYREVALFFYDGYGGNVITGVWNQTTKLERRWKVNLGWSTIPHKQVENTEHTAVINKHSILNEIVRLGGDMIDSLQIQKS